MEIVWNIKKTYEFNAIKKSPSDLWMWDSFIFNEASSSLSHLLPNTGRHRSQIFVKASPSRVQLTLSSNPNNTMQHRSTSGMIVLARLLPNSLPLYSRIASPVRINVWCNNFNSSSKSRWIFEESLRSTSNSVIWTTRRMAASATRSAEREANTLISALSWDRVSGTAVNRGS